MHLIVRAVLTHNCFAAMRSDSGAGAGARYVLVRAVIHLSLMVVQVTGATVDAHLRIFR